MNYVQCEGAIYDLLEDVSDRIGRIELEIFSPRINRPLLIYATYSQCKALLKELDLKPRKRNNLQKIRKAAEIWKWASDLSFELNVNSMGEFSSCVRIIVSRYDKWRDAFFNNYEQKFRIYCREIKDLMVQYSRGYNERKPQFPSAVSAVSHFIKHGPDLKCFNLQEYIKRAQNAYGVGSKKSERKSGKICETYENGDFVNGFTKGVYFLKNVCVEIATFHARKLNMLNKTFTFLRIRSANMFRVAPFLANGQRF